MSDEWPPEREAGLKRMFYDNITIVAIAREHGLTPGAIASKLHGMGLYRVPVTTEMADRLFEAALNGRRFT